MAGFHVGKERVLLRFIEAMDFVHEHDGARAGARLAFGGSHDFFDFLDACKHRAEGNKFRTGQTSDQPRERGLAATRRSPEKHGAEVVVFNLHAKCFAGSEKSFLADELIERARAHAFGQRLMRQGYTGIDRFRQFREQAHGFCSFRAGRVLRCRAAS